MAVKPKSSVKTKAAIKPKVAVKPNKKISSKQAESQREATLEALRRSEEKYRTILEITQEGYFEVDLAGNFTFLNDSIPKIWGYTREELMGMNYKKYTDKEISRKVFEAYSRIYKTGEPIKALEEEIIRKDGTKRFGEASVSLIKDSAGNPIGFRGMTRDITERKLAEEALRQSEERYRTILERIQDGYVEVDLAGNFTFFNDSMCRIWGYPSDELAGMNYRQYSDKESAKRLFEMFNEVYRTGKPIEGVDWQIIRKDGTKRFIEASVSLQKDSSGKPIGFLGITRDVTERRQAEEALRQSEERYRTILDEMEDAYFEVDLAGNFTFVNDAHNRHLGYSREELLGASFRGQIAKEEIGIVFNAFRNIYRTGKPERGISYKLVRKDGTTAFVETAGFPLRNQKGEIIGFKGVGRDITERKQMEEALRQSEERYRTIIEEMEEWYFETDLAGNMLFFNDAITRALRYPPQELTGLNFRTFIKQEQAEEIYKIFHQVYEIGEPVKNFPQEFVRPDGSITFAEFSIFPKRDRGGKIFGFRGVGHDITERKKTEQQLNYMATHDILTGLPNRMLFMDRLKMALAHAKRNKHKLAVMMLDLDRFKNINDTLGHMIGDRLLKEAGLRLTGLLRQNDTISRLGGDEFIILLPEIMQREDSAEVAEKVAKAIQQSFIFDSYKLTISTSIGIAIYPDDCQDIDSLMKNADMAMYSVKAHGRNSYQFFTNINC